MCDGTDGADIGETLLENVVILVGFRGKAEW